MADLYLDELTVGQILKQVLYRKIIEAGNIWDNTLTHTPLRRHQCDRYYPDNSEFGKRNVNDCFKLSLKVGSSVKEATIGVLAANPGANKVCFVAPVFMRTLCVLKLKLMSHMTASLNSLLLSLRLSNMSKNKMTTWLVKAVKTVCKRNSPKLWTG